MLATVEGVQGEADHRRRSRSRARQGAAKAVRRDVQRSAAPRRRACRSRSRRATGACSSCSATAGASVTPADVQRVALAYFKPSNRTVGEFIPDAKPDRAPTPPRSTSRRWSRTTRATPASPPAKRSTPTPANLEARTQRFTLPNGMKVALLPKKTRGETVQRRSCACTTATRSRSMGKSPTRRPRRRRC